MMTSSNKPDGTSSAIAAMIVRIVCATLLIVSFNTCKHNPVDAALGDPRTYLWSIDTLRLDPTVYGTMPQQILLQSAFGTADNLYAVGWSSGTAGSMWHFDGASWSNVRLGDFEGGPIPAPFNLSAIHGASSQNIYAVGGRVGPTSHGRSFVLHFSASRWQEEAVPGGYRLLSVCVNATNDVWACGDDRTVLHCDGVRWVKDSLNVDIPSGTLFYLSSIARAQGEMWMLGVAYNLSPPSNYLKYYFFRRQEGTWTVADTFELNNGVGTAKWGGANLMALPTGSIYSCDWYGVFRWTGGSWNRCFENNKAVLNVFGSSESNVFAAGGHGLLAHYNGTDWYEYPDLSNSNVTYGGGWCDERQSFVFGWVDNNNTVVLRGRNLAFLRGQ